MFNNIIELLLIVGAIAWWSEALVNKEGPLGIFAKFRTYTFLAAYKLSISSPLTCTFCTGFYVGIAISLLWLNGFHSIVSFFGILGLASALGALTESH